MSEITGEYGSGRYEPQGDEEAAGILDALTNLTPFNAADERIIAEAAAEIERLQERERELMAEVAALKENILQFSARRATNEWTA